MAKKKTKTEEVFDPVDGETKKKEGGKLSSILLIFLIFIIWLGIFSLLIKMDVGGIGSTLLRPLLKDVPILNLILPDASDEELIWEQNYPYKNIQEAAEIIKDLERQIEQLKETNATYPGQVADLTAEIERLKVFEDEQLAFEERVRQFDIGVVFNPQAPGIEEYAKYYEEINPETAEEIYRQVREQLEFDESIKEKAELLRKMKPDAAAMVIQEMTADTGWICKVMLAMKSDDAVKILNKCEALFVAKLLQKMQDMDDERMKAIQNSLLQ